MWFQIIKIYTDMTPKTQFNTLKLLIIQSLLMSKVNLEADATPIGVMVHLY